MAKELSSALLAWYADFGRDLPWRETHDPYAIWVSEVMLHQTQVATALPFYQRFLARFPTVGQLAAATLDQVLKAWEGMGYYARARNLHAAARRVVAEHGGRVPDAWDQLIALPGVGEYTAGAILSIAYGQDLAAIDGNVRRVISRLFNVTDEISGPLAQRRIREIVAGLLPSGQVGDFNQALMDLGARVCRPRQPQCLLCPLARFCQSRRLGVQAELPVRAQRRPVPHHEVAAAVIWRDSGRQEFLVAQRPPAGLLGGLWEFPGGKREEGETLSQCLRREIDEELGFRIEVGELLTVIQHAYTHFRITMHAFHARALGDTPRAIQVADWRWITLDQVEGLPFSAADHKIIAALREVGQPNSAATSGAEPPADQA